MGFCEELQVSLRYHGVPPPHVVPTLPFPPTFPQAPFHLFPIHPSTAAAAAPAPAHAAAATVVSAAAIVWLKQLWRFSPITDTCVGGECRRHGARWSNMEVWVT